jgi:hypothetical protein
MGVTSVRKGVAVVREPGGQGQRVEQCVEMDKDPEAKLKDIHWQRHCARELGMNKFL